MIAITKFKQVYKGTGRPRIFLVDNLQLHIYGEIYTTCQKNGWYKLLRTNKHLIYFPCYSGISGIHRSLICNHRHLVYI